MYFYPASVFLFGVPPLRHLLTGWHLWQAGPFLKNWSIGDRLTDCLVVATHLFSKFSKHLYHAAHKARPSENKEWRVLPQTDWGNKDGSLLPHLRKTSTTMHGCIEKLTISQSPGYVHRGRVGEGEQNPGYPQNLEFRETNTPGGPWSKCQYIGA